MHHPDEPTPMPAVAASDAPGDPTNHPPGALDPAIEAARAAPLDPSADVAAIDPLQKQRDALLLADPSNPNHALFEQALHGLEQLGTKRFKDRRELERIALAIAVQASAVGLTRVDRVALSDNGAGVFFADSQAVDPALRGYVALAEAIKPEATQRPLDVQRLQAHAQEQRAGEAQQQQQAQQVQREAEQQARQDRSGPERASQERAAQQERTSQERSAQQNRASQDRDARQDRAAADRASQQDRASQDRAAQDRATQERAPRRL